MGLFDLLSPNSLFGGGGGGGSPLGGGGSSSSSLSATGGDAFNKTSSTTTNSNNDTTSSYADSSINTDLSDNRVIDSRLWDYRQWLTDSSTTTNTDSSVNQGAGALLAGGDISITDGGAFDLARYLSALVGGASTQAVSLAGGTVYYADQGAARAERTAARGFDLAETVTRLGRDLSETMGRLSGQTAQSVIDQQGRTTAQAFDLTRYLADLIGSSSQRTTGQAFDLARNLVDSTSGQVTGAAQRLGGQAFDLAGQLADGVISSSRTTTGQAFDAAQRLADSQQTFLGNVLSKTFAATDQVTSLVANAYNDAKGRGSQTDTIILAAVAGTLVVAFLALRSRRS